MTALERVCISHRHLTVAVQTCLLGFASVVWMKLAFTYLSYFSSVLAVKVITSIVSQDRGQMCRSKSFVLSHRCARSHIANVKTLPKVTKWAASAAEDKESWAQGEACLLSGALAFPLQLHVWTHLIKSSSGLLKKRQTVCGIKYTGDSQKHYLPCSTVERLNKLWW